MKQDKSEEKPGSEESVIISLTERFEIIEMKLDYLIRELVTSSRKARMNQDTRFHPSTF